MIEVASAVVAVAAAAGLDTGISDCQEVSESVLAFALDPSAASSAGTVAQSRSLEGPGNEEAEGDEELATAECLFKADRSSSIPWANREPTEAEYATVADD